MKFAVGDRVVIVKPKNAEKDKDITYWVPEMDEYIGKSVTIAKIFSEYDIILNNIKWHWKETWLKSELEYFMEEMTE